MAGYEDSSATEQRGATVAHRVPIQPQIRERVGCWKFWDEIDPSRDGGMSGWWIAVTREVETSFLRWANRLVRGCQVGPDLREDYVGREAAGVAIGCLAPTRVGRMKEALRRTSGIASLA
ncbi:hypothetical protein LOC70_24075 [Rhodopirellula sp. JC737]|nr:hypothetical protein [Rhodopirellula sp. JC737]